MCMYVLGILLTHTAHTLTHTIFLVSRHTYKAHISVISKKNETEIYDLIHISHAISSICTWRNYKNLTIYIYIYIHT
jgi:hypothetical protein